MGLVSACGWLATVCLTIYPAVAITRMVRRRSSLDYSLPGFVLVVVGLAAYLVTVWESPGWLTGTISLGWNMAMLITVAVFRLPKEYKCEDCGANGAKAHYADHEGQPSWLCATCSGD